MNEKLLLGIVSMLALSSPSVVTAADHHYRNDNAYFSSKYHHKHSYHWQNANKHEERVILFTGGVIITTVFILKVAMDVKALVSISVVQCGNI